MHDIGQFVVLHFFDVLNKRLNQPQEFLKSRPLAESVEMLLNGFPFDSKNIPLLLFYAVGQLVSQTFR